jgi:hypothetical protein
MRAVYARDADGARLMSRRGLGAQAALLATLADIDDDQRRNAMDACSKRSSSLTAGE